MVLKPGVPTSLLPFITKTSSLHPCCDGNSPGQEWSWHVALLLAWVSFVDEIPKNENYQASVEIHNSIDQPSLPCLSGFKPQALKNDSLNHCQLAAT